MRKPKLGFFTDRKGNKIYMRNLVGKEVSFKGALTPDIIITQPTTGKIVEVMTYQTGEVVNPTIKIEFYNQLNIMGGEDNHLLDGSHL